MAEVAKRIANADWGVVRAEGQVQLAEREKTPAEEVPADEEPEAEEPAPVVDTVPRQRWADLAAGDSDEDEEAAPAAAAEEVGTLKALMEKAEAQLGTAREAETTSLRNYEMLAQGLSDEIKLRAGRADGPEHQRGHGARRGPRCLGRGRL